MDRNKPDQGEQVYGIFYKKNCLPDIIECGGDILREQTSGKSKLDFLVNDTYIEIKSPLIMLPLKPEYKTNKNLKYRASQKFTSFERFVKHLNELSATLKNHQKAILISFYMFEAEKFIPPRDPKNKNPVMKTVAKATREGVETWQVNAKFDRYGVEVADYYRRKY